MKTWKQSILGIEFNIAFDNASYLLGGNELFNLDIITDEYYVPFMESSFEEQNILIKLEDALLYD